LEEKMIRPVIFVSALTDGAVGRDTSAGCGL
jgi:hypothetical protein